ncbi:DUF6483 family protein [Clostridium sp. LBM24168]
MLKQTLTNELIKKFTYYLNSIETKKCSDDYKSAIKLIDDAFKDIFRLGLKFFNSFTTENIIDMASTNRRQNTDKCIMIAKLLEEEGSILQRQDKLNEAFYINQKSLNIFLDAYINKSDHCELEEYFNDIQPLIDDVFQYKLPITLEEKIKDYYISINKYDKAEDIIYYILEETKYDTTYIEYALKFYNNLLSKEDLDLKNGGLSKLEIKKSITELESKL